MHNETQENKKYKKFKDKTSRFSENTLSFNSLWEQEVTSQIKNSRIVVKNSGWDKD